MAVRRINSTGRKRILREDVRITVRAEGGSLIFDASLNLNEYELPDDALVFVEAYRQTTFMRFPFGTVASPTPPAHPSRHLSEFSSPEGLLFRVKVTACDGSAGVLLAEADSVPISDEEEQPDKRIALLPTVPGDLGQETWRLDFAGNGPLLMINSNLGDWKGVAASPLFRSLVYPAAMRQVLWHAFRIEETRDMDDLAAWGSRWLRFAASLPGVVTPPLDTTEDDDWIQWIDSAVESFSRQHRMLDHYRTHLAEDNA